MKIGVSGASGHLGRAVVSELLQRHGGHEVVAITRTPENVSGPAQGRFGDYNRPEQRRPMVRPERPCRHHERHALNSEAPAPVAPTGQTQGELA
jgi:nucleoside-diphosphate-sugar epimerase